MKIAGAPAGRSDGSMQSKCFAWWYFALLDLWLSVPTYPRDYYTYRQCGGGGKEGVKEWG